MTADRLPAELADWPAWTPGEEQLGELELITSGAFAPADRVPRPPRTWRPSQRAASSPTAPPGRSRSRSRSRPAPLPGDADHLVLQDPEGSPLAVVEITERVAAPTRRTTRAPRTALRLAGPVTALRPPEHGPFRALRRRPADVRAELGSVPRCSRYATRRPLGQRQIGQLRHLADQLRARILLLPLVAGRADLVVRPEALVRAVLAAARQLPDGTLVVPVPLPPQRRARPTTCAARAVVAAAYGATHLLNDGGRATAETTGPFGQIGF